MIQRAEADPTGILEGIGISMKRMMNYFDQVVYPTLSKAHPAKQFNQDALWNDFVSMQSIVSSRSFVVDLYHVVHFTKI